MHEKLTRLSSPELGLLHLACLNPYPGFPGFCATPTHAKGSAQMHSGLFPRAREVSSAVCESPGNGTEGVPGNGRGQGGYRSGGRHATRLFLEIHFVPNLVELQARTSSQVPGNCAGGGSLRVCHRNCKTREASSHKTIQVYARILGGTCSHPQAGSRSRYQVSSCRGCHTTHLKPGQSIFRSPV
jgi:hypothetical protein